MKKQKNKYRILKNKIKENHDNPNTSYKKNTIKNLAKIIIFISILTILFSVKVIASKPTLEYISVESISDSKVIVKFKANMPINYTLRYGETNLFERISHTTDKINNSEKKVTLYGLSPTKEYKYKVNICNQNSECSLEGPYTFKIKNSIEETKESLSESKDWSLMGKGKNDMYIRSNINIQRLSFNIARELKYTSAKISKLNLRPKGIPYLTTKTYRYYKLETTEIPKNNLISINVFFSVAKEWLIFNNIDKDKISIFGYNKENDWLEFDAKIMSEDSNYYYYSSTITVFDYFSIAKKTSQPKKIITTTTSSTTSSTITTTTTDNVEKESPSILKFPKLKTNFSEIENKLITTFKNKNGPKIITITITITLVLIITNLLFLMRFLKTDKTHYKELKIYSEKNDINKTIKIIKKYIRKKDYKNARKQYAILEKLYKELTHEEKHKHYNKIEKTIEELSQVRHKIR